MVECVLLAAFVEIGRTRGAPAAFRRTRTHPREMPHATDSQRAERRGRYETESVTAKDDGAKAQSQQHDRHGAHGHENAHTHGAEHADEGLIGTLRAFVAPNSHDAKDSVDQVLEGSRDGIRVVAISLVILLLTAGIQALVVSTSGSVALLGDTLHNAVDALTAVPLRLAVLAIIFGSAAFAGYQSVDRLIHPQKITDLALVMAAAVVGAVGNEAVAQYRIRVGRRIGSAALEADGIHARTHGLTSLLVLIGAIAVGLGAQRADAVVGLVITAAILVVGFHAARNVGQRLLDAIDPAIVARIAETVSAVDGVAAVTEVRARCMGHRLMAQVRLSVDWALPVTSAHDIAEVAHHELLHRISTLSDAIIHVDPNVAGVDLMRQRPITAVLRRQGIQKATGHVDVALTPSWRFPKRRFGQSHP